MAHGVVRLDKVLAAHNGNLESVQHTVDMDNGSFVHVGNLVAGSREVHSVVVPATATISDQEVVLVAAPEVIYRSFDGTQLDAFYTEAGTPARAFHLTKGDVVSISSDMFTGLPTDRTQAIGKYVAPQDGSVKLAYSATKPTTRFIGVIDAVETFGINAKEVVQVRVLNS